MSLQDINSSSVGWGTGMNSLSCMTAYQPYFTKRKALSLGITGAGSGVGTLVLSALLRVLFDNFSFSGAILLYGTFICYVTIWNVHMLYCYFVCSYARLLHGMLICQIVA